MNPDSAIRHVAASARGKSRSTSGWTVSGSSPIAGLLFFWAYSAPYLHVLEAKHFLPPPLAYFCAFMGFLLTYFLSHSSSASQRKRQRILQLPKTTANGCRLALHRTTAVIKWPVRPFLPSLAVVRIGAAGTVGGGAVGPSSSRGGGARGGPPPAQGQVPVW